MGSWPIPKALLGMKSNPPPKALSLVGSCPSLDMLPWAGYLSPIPHFKTFCTHEPRIRIDGFFSSPGRFVARISAFVATTEGCTGCGSISPAADTVFVSNSAIPIEGGTGSAEALPAATPTAQNTYLSRGVLHRRLPPPRPPVKLCPSPLCVAVQPLRRRRRADEQRQQRVMHPAVDYGFWPCRGPRASSRRGTTPSRAPRPRPAPPAAATPALANSPACTVPPPSDHDHAEPTWELSYG